MAQQRLKVFLEQSKHVNLTQQNDFGPTFLHSFSRLVNGPTKVKSISSSAWYVTLPKYFSHPSLLSINTLIIINHYPTIGHLLYFSHFLFFLKDFLDHGCTN
jgi:hypothetical protein